MHLDHRRIEAALERQTGSGRAYPKPQEVSGLGVLKLSGVADTIKALRQTKTALNTIVARSLSAIAVDLLSHSLYRAPIDTGELRKSGRAILWAGRKQFIVGYGTAEERGKVRANLAAFSAKDLKGVKSLRADVSFKKVENGLDIALWLHEDLLYYHQRPDTPAARTPGTGPKYLSGPFEERQNLYVSWLKGWVSDKYISKQIALATKVKQKRVGKYEVDIVNVIPEKVGWESAWLKR